MRSQPVYVTAVSAERHRGKDLKLGQPDQRVMTSTWHKAMASLSPAPARSDAAPQMDIRLETHLSARYWAAGCASYLCQCQRAAVSMPMGYVLSYKSSSE